jgi:hypothetical protein
MTLSTMSQRDSKFTMTISVPSRCHAIRGFIAGLLFIGTNFFVHAATIHVFLTQQALGKAFASAMQTLVAPN